MSQIAAARSVLTTLGSPSILPNGEARPVEAPDRVEYEDERKFRREVQRKNGRGIILDKMV
jgi:hypothetical protein